MHEGTLLQKDDTHKDALARKVTFERRKIFQEDTFE